jgi:ABC-type lipoprotein release transport system permease subunit
LLGTLLYRVSPLDAATFAAVAGLIVAAAGCATYLPARRATGISAASALRAD